MKIESTDYTTEGHNATNPTLKNVTVTIVVGIRLQDSSAMYVKDCQVENLSDNAIFLSGSYKESDESLMNVLSIGYTVKDGQKD